MRLGDRLGAVARLAFRGFDQPRFVATRKVDHIDNHRLVFGDKAALGPGFPRELRAPVCPLGAVSALWPIHAFRPVRTPILVAILIAVRVPVLIAVWPALSATVLPVTVILLAVAARLRLAAL